MFQINMKMLWLMVGLSVSVIGCKSTDSGYAGQGVGPSLNGPAYKQALGSNKPRFAYDKSVFLDVAIPIIDPGLPLDYFGNVDQKQLIEENIWPEIRRLESKRFSINIRDAIAQTKAFSSVRVVPDPSVSADLYVLGKINESKTIETTIGVTLVDATNKKWAEKSFSMEANTGFYRDRRNLGKDLNQDLYKRIAQWVYKQVQRRSNENLQEIKQVANMRYAAMYSPESFSGYLDQKRNGQISLNGLPADDDAVLSRVKEYHAQEMAFVDSLQDEYDVFFAETKDAYLTYQEESLRIQEKIEEQRAERNGKIFGAVLLTAAAVIAAKENSNLGDVAATVGGLAAAGAFASAIGDNAVVGEYQDVYEEVGQSLDLKVSPQLRAFEDKQVELTGTAAEQYVQWRSHLLNIYKQTETPDIQL